MPANANRSGTGSGTQNGELIRAPGGAIRDIAMGMLLLTRELQHDVKIRNIVVDTNVLLNDLGYLCRTGKQTTLLAEADSGFVRLMVTPQIIDEVNEHIPIYAKNVRIEPKVMFSKWAEYQRTLVVVDPPRSRSDPVMRLSARDPDDVPTAELIELLAPELALSSDKDLQDLGFSQNGDWLSHVLYMSKVIEHDAVSIAVRVGGAILIVGFSEAAVGLSRAVSAAIQRVPKRILWTLFASLAALLLVPRTRQWIANCVKELMAKVEQFKPPVSQALQEILVVLQTKNTEWRQAEEFLSERRKLGGTIPTSLRGYAIRVLAQSPYPLRPEEIMQHAQVLGYKPRGLASVKYLRTLLRRDPVFYAPDGYRWSLVKPEV